MLYLNQSYKEGSTYLSGVCGKIQRDICLSVYLSYPSVFLYVCLSTLTKMSNCMGAYMVAVKM